MTFWFEVPAHATDLKMYTSSDEAHLEGDLHCEGDESDNPAYAEEPPPHTLGCHSHRRVLTRFGPLCLVFLVMDVAGWPQIPSRLYKQIPDSGLPCKNQVETK